MNEISRRDFGAVFCALTLTPFGIAKAEAAPTKSLGGAGRAPTYPIAARVATTAERTIAPGPNPSLPIALHDLARYDRVGAGKWTFGAPLPHIRRGDLLPAGREAAARGARLLTFFTLSDIHITDKEAPNQGIYIQRMHPTTPVGTSLYSGVMLYTTHVLDAAVQTINALHAKQPFDFGLSLGDVCNSSQFNELRWYIDVLDGKAIRPSSGAHLGAGRIDYQKPFEAAGLDKSIPWYQVLGNHDHFWLGSIPVDHGLRKDLRASYTADEVFAAGDVLVDPSRIRERTFYMGVLDGSKPLGDVRYAGVTAEFAAPPKIAADPDRRPLLRAEWMKEFFDTASTPVGHGFDKAALARGFACYSFVPKADVPVKVISLDDTQNEDDGSPDIHGHGFLDAERWAWLKAELAAGDAAGQLMIIAAHIPIGVEPTGPRSPMGWWMDPQNAVTLPELVAELHAHPNLLMWLAGHRHLNTVKAFVSPDPAAPEKGFWQVETCSLRDFPQQFRTFEIFVNADQTISIVTTNVDPAVAEGSPAAKSRKFAVGAQQIVRADIRTANPTKDPTIHPMPTGSYNAELVVPVTPAMAAALEARFPAK